MRNYRTDSSEAASHKAAFDDPASTKPQRFSAKLKTRIVTRLLRGEGLELLAREYGAAAAQISKWSDDFLAA